MQLCVCHLWLFYPLAPPPGGRRVDRRTLLPLLVVVPGLQQLTPITERLRLTLSLEARFRTVMWPAVGIVLFTGLVNVMNVFSGTVLVGERLPSGFVQVLSVKLRLVFGMVLLQAVQQFIVQPRRVAWLRRLDVACRNCLQGFLGYNA